MKYHIDTIPVWDAVKKECECPFCLLQDISEAKQVDFYLSDAMMQVHIRKRTNEVGFCDRHYDMMLKNDRKLSMALMCHTHGNHLLSEIKKPMDALISDISSSKKSAKNIDMIIDYIDELDKKCVVCQDIDYNITRYLHTYIHLYKKDPAFKETMLESKGFCLKHFADLLKVAKTELSGRTRGEFISQIVNIQKTNMERLGEEVKWFCDKFDYRHRDKPWENSKDSLPRMATKLGGRLLK